MKMWLTRDRGDDKEYALWAGITPKMFSVFSNGGVRRASGIAIRNVRSPTIRALFGVGRVRK